MIILEDTNREETYKRAIDYCTEQVEQNNFKFDTTIDGLNMWCDNDKDKTIFFQDEDGGYATLSAVNIRTDIDSCIESLKYQIDETSVSKDDEE